VAVGVDFLLDDGVGDLAENIGHELGRLGARLRSWLARVARPVRGVRLHSVDGSEFSGLLLCDRNTIVAMLVVHNQPVAALREPPPRAPYREPSPYLDEGPWREGDEIPFWHR
jgi:hypothetical protein